MLIDINLLPKKEKKNFSLSIMLALLILLFITGVSLSFYYAGVLKSKSQQLTLKNQQVTQNLQLEQEQVEIAQSTNSVVELKKAVDWAQSYPIKSVPVLQHLTSLLPERGFIQQYFYSEEGKVQLTVQFDTSREAAYFLKWLNDSVWVADATILSLNLGNSTDTETENTDLPKTEYVPRYIGSYDITLERAKVKDLISIVKSEKGGDSE